MFAVGKRDACACIDLRESICMYNFAYAWSNTHSFTLSPVSYTFRK